MEKWTMAKYKAHCKAAHKDAASDGLDNDDCWYDLAQGAIMCEPGLKEFINKKLGASDAVGRLADDLSEG